MGAALGSTSFPPRSQVALGSAPPREVALRNRPIVGTQLSNPETWFSIRPESASAERKPGRKKRSFKANGRPQVQLGNEGQIQNRPLRRGPAAKRQRGIARISGAGGNRAPSTGKASAEPARARPRRSQADERRIRQTGRAPSPVGYVKCIDTTPCFPPHPCCRVRPRSATARCLAEETSPPFGKFAPLLPGATRQRPNPASILEQTLPWKSGVTRGRVGR